MADDDRFYVKSLTLENFRCFEKTELGPFDPHFNLLVGENGSGKSSVLVALSYLFSQLGTRPGERIPLAGRTSEIRRIVDSEDLLNRIVPHSASLNAEFEAPTFSSRDTKSKSLRSLVSISDQGEGIFGETRFLDYDLPEYAQRNIASILPLALFYTVDRRFVRSDRSSANDDSLTSDRFQALRNWNNAGAVSHALQDWLRDETLAKFQGDARYLVDDPRSADPVEGYFLDLINSAIVASVEDATNITYSGKFREILLTYSNDRNQKFSEMSDGQRALIGMIADIARRMCILNGASLQGRAIAETPGLVLIDEIDLHLHPKWQRQIVGALKRIFPKIQFFATTHSPQVIGQAKPEEIVMLTKDGRQERPSRSLGMDSNWVLECVMRADGRDPATGVKIKQMHDALDAGEFDLARALMDELRAKIGEDPSVAATDAYLWNLEVDHEEAAE